MSLLDLDLEDADIGVTDLRDPGKLAQQLRTKRRLRVRKGSQTIGVFVSTPAWRELQERFDALQAALEERDDEALAALLVERKTDDQPWVRGASRSAASVIADSEQIVHHRLGKSRKR